MLRKSLAALLVMASASFGAQAVTIDFESTGTQNSVNNLDYAISGFVFNSTMDNIDISSSAPWSATGPAHSGRYTGLNNYYGNGEISLLGGGTFSFQDLWLKGWYGNNTTVTVSGWLNGVEVGSVIGQLSASWVNFAGNFASIDLLRIAPSSGAFLVDDITLNQTAPIPEPETYAMLLAGLGLMGAVARRQKKLAV